MDLEYGGFAAEEPVLEGLVNVLIGDILSLSIPQIRFQVRFKITKNPINKQSAALSNSTEMTKG